MPPHLIAGRLVAFSLLVGVLIVPVTLAASFISAFYDARTDKLVVTLSYRGINPGHEFTLLRIGVSIPAAASAERQLREPRTDAH
jgi:hypothetical protein